MTKREIVQRVKDAAGLEFGDRTVMRHIASAFNTIAGQLFGTKMGQWEYYSKEIDLTVTDRKADLPMALIQTQPAMNGVPRITDECGSTMFYPVMPSQLNIHVDAAAVSGFVFYSVTANTIKFCDRFPMGDIPVKATVIPEFHEWNDDDYINLPSGADAALIDMAVAFTKGGEAYTNLYKRKA